MRLGLILAVSFAVGIGLCSDSSAQESEKAQQDTAATMTLFNPPSVITPEDTAGAKSEASKEAAEQKVRISVRTGKGPQGEKPSPAPCGKCSESKRPRFGGGGGPVPGYLSANLDKINSKIRQMGIPDLSEDIFIMGGKGYARIGGFVIGGAGYGGRTETSGIPDCCARYAEVELGYGGVILGYSMTDARYEATLGMLFGGGSVKVTRKRNSRNVFGWDESWDIFKDDTPDSVATEDLNTTSYLEGGFIALEPFVEVKYWLLPFMALDFSASYLRANIGDGEWKLDGIKIPDSPETDIGGPSVKLGIHFGV
jgi:hypothetical protein